jgi:hypothetical protein
VFARQPCYPIPRTRDVGQWLCVPPFRVVCPYQAFTLAAKDAYFTRTQQRWYGTLGAATRALGTPDNALDFGGMSCRCLPSCTITIALMQSTCHHESNG